MTADNDVRPPLAPGCAFLTPAIAALGWEKVERIFQTVVAFDDFCNCTGLVEPPDIGWFPVDGKEIYFKIDLYNKSFTSYSPDPNDPEKTERVISILTLDDWASEDTVLPWLWYPQNYLQRADVPFDDPDEW